MFVILEFLAVGRSIPCVVCVLRSGGRGVVVIFESFIDVIRHKYIGVALGLILSMIKSQ